ncbi:facilitated trehalose transporter Tret1-2 homolog isoform X2 [Drosophila sulfurigaster albostrigata]|uniref:facilitated trehalose transporter Tret1-2 homolog isoform X2 n=1 Tax=Drosophila sulfurigaster albostrigata TaxID=89887 RepID=UPI002D21BDAF|nr:facilitated trehalose transporter Tret1-2 homolog isoform X2 [Drosophila sulfurigaster albostrigata]
MSDKSEKLSVLSLTQIIAAFGFSMCAFSIGNAAAYTSPALPSMKNKNVTSFSVSAQEASWVGGIMPLAGLLGGILGGPLIMYVGRKTTAMLSFIPFFIGWTLIAFASSVAMLLVGRGLSGFAVGVASLALPVYLSEAIHPLIRGILGLMPTLIGNFGMLSCFIIGYFANWSLLAIISGLLCIPFLVLLFFVPESPRWYLTRGKPEKAESALARLRRKNNNVADEFKEMTKRLADEAEGSNTCKDIFQKKYFKPVSIAVALMIFQQLSGISAVIFYTVMIFNMSDSSVDSYLSTIIVGTVNFLASLLAIFNIDHSGRKVLLITSALSMIITLFVLSAFFYCKSREMNIDGGGWVPLVCLVIYVLGFSMGFGPIPWLMMGEILPSRIRAPAASLVVGCNWAFTFIVTKTFQDLIVPETKNKSLEQIEEELTGGSGK